MAKKNLNPADAYRKAQRKKELKKNKAERSKARDFAYVKKDTRDIEDEIEKLEALPTPNSVEKARLSELKSELQKINEKKEEYLQEHPEQRRLVYKARHREGDKDEEKKPLKKDRNKFDKNGIPRHPERSIYYDPVMNLYGVPPPGMPYVERALLPGEVDSDEEMEDSDEDIPLPPGLPPGSELVRDDDDIPMPDGPPPDDDDDDDDIPLPPPETSAAPPLPPGLPPVGVAPGGFVGNPPLPPGFPMSGYPGAPPLPPAHPTGAIPAGFNRPPPPPPGPPPFPPNTHIPIGLPSFPPPPPFPPTSVAGIPPPPPPGFNGVLPPPPPVGFPNSFPTEFAPAPPPGFYPRQRNQASGSMQDPLSSIPHQTYQAHREDKLRSTLPHNPSLPPKPVAAAQLANATVSAAPELRDFKKEATAFVPTAIKRKKAPGAGSSRVDAAPSVGPVEGEGEPDAAPARPDLVGMLKQQFGSAPPPAPVAVPSTKSNKEIKKDDYAKFMEEMKDIL